MNARPQTHAKMADSARTHMEAMNANANLDLREKIAKQVGYQLQTKNKPLAVGLVDLRPNSVIIIMMMIITIMIMIIITTFYSDYYQ